MAWDALAHFTAQADKGIRIEKPADLVPHIRHYVDRKQEHFICASVNGANEIINWQERM